MRSAPHEVAHQQLARGGGCARDHLLPGVDGDLRRRAGRRSARPDRPATTLAAVASRLEDTAVGAQTLAEMQHLSRGVRFSGSNLADRFDWGLSTEHAQRL